MNDMEQIDQVKDRIERIPEVFVVTAGQMTQQILSLVGSSKTLMFSVLIIALVIAAVGVLNTVLMSVMEKMREFAYMRCVGASPVHISKIVLIETLTLSIAGAVFGVIMGILGSSLADNLIRRVLPYAPAGKMVVFNLGMLVLTLLIISAMGALAGVYPSWKAAQASPMEAVRNE